MFETRLPVNHMFQIVERFKMEDKVEARVSKIEEQMKKIEADMATLMEKHEVTHYLLQQFLNTY